MGSFGGAQGCKQIRVRPPNDPKIQRAPTLAPGFHSFWKRAIASSFDWFSGLSVFFVIGQSQYYYTRQLKPSLTACGYEFTTLKKLLRETSSRQAKAYL